MSPNYKEHALSQKVLEFLIAQQDSFIIWKRTFGPRETLALASVFQRYLAQIPVSTLFNLVYCLDLISVCRNQLFLMICIIRYVFSVPSFVP